MAMSQKRRVLLIVGCIVLALAVAGVLGLALLVMSLRNDEPDIRDNSVLVLKVEGMLPDYVGDDPIASRFFGKPSQSLTGLMTELKKAKSDKRVSAVLVDIGFVGMGWAKVEELRDAIADFRASGKPAYAYMEYGADQEYYLASSCERIYVAPVGDLFINGLAAEVMFFRGSLDKLGVYPDFYQIGKYKNAPDQFTRKEMSEPHREWMNSLIDELFNRYVESVARDRHKSVEEIRALIDNAPFSAKEAKEAGLIDATSYRDEVEAELKKRLGYKEADKLRLVKESDYRRVSLESLGLNEGERIAVIFASGPIGSGHSNSGFGEDTVGSDTVSKAIRDAAEDKTVKAIVLRVDSPGGTNYGSDIIWHAVEAAKKKKPVVASMSDVAASGGYYISTNANRIVAEPSTITGSIGVYAGKQVIKGFYNWIGVSSEYVMRGKTAGMFRETEPFTDEERAKFKAMINSAYYDEFVPKVAEGRHRSADYIDSVGQGRVWTGRQAKENGLVDEFGGLDRAVEIAKELAHIPKDKSVRRVVFPAPRSFFQSIFGGDDDDTEASLQARQQQQQRQAMLQAMPEDLRRAFRYSTFFDQIRDGQVMTMLPYEIRIK